MWDDIVCVGVVCHVRNRVCAIIGYLSQMGLGRSTCPAEDWRPTVIGLFCAFVV
jgi:hypothetical protein